MRSMGDREEVLHDAMRLGKITHVDAPEAHHAAFANVVNYLVTGWSGGYGGPSMREHWAILFALGRGLVAGEVEYDEAIRVVEKICFGPLTLEIAWMKHLEPCFDDAPGEREAADRLILFHGVRN